MPRIKTKEELEREREAQQFIKEREKLASQQGISSKAAGQALVPLEQERLNALMQKRQEVAAQPLAAEFLKKQEGIQPEIIQPQIPPSIQTPFERTEIPPLITDVSQLPIGQALPEAITQAGLGAAAAAVPAGIVVATGVGAPAAPFIIAGGATIGFIKGFISGLQKETREEVAVDFESFKSARKGIPKLIAAQNKGIGNTQDNQELYFKQISRIQEAHEKIHILNRDDLTNFLSDGADEEEEISSWLELQKPIYDQMFADALTKPNPNTIFPMEEGENI